MSKATFLSFLSVFLILFFLISCSTTESEKEALNLETIETVIPKQFSSFDSIGEKYYSFLGLDTFVNKEGRLIIPAWNPSEIYLTNERGDSLFSATRLGRGPGELLSTGDPTKDSDGNIYVYDEMLKKMVIYDSNLNLITEFMPKKPDEGSISRYFSITDNQIIVEINDDTWPSRRSSESFVYLASYNPDTDSYSNVREIQDRPMAKMFREGGVAAGGFRVPFSAGHYVASNLVNNTLFSFYSGSNIIAELDANLDTIRTISVNLPTEPMSQTEIGEIFSNAYTDNFDNLRELLPEIKNPVEDMKVDNEGRIWIESTLSGEKTSWFILNSEGEILKRVMLPKNLHLTHVHRNHLGIRLDETTFALFESVSLED